MKIKIAFWTFKIDLHKSYTKWLDLKWFFENLHFVKISNGFCGCLSSQYTSPWTNVFNTFQIETKNMFFIKFDVYLISSTYTVYRTWLSRLFWVWEKLFVYYPGLWVNPYCHNLHKIVLRFRLKDANEHTCYKSLGINEKRHKISPTN